MRREVPFIGLNSKCAQTVIPKLSRDYCFFLLLQGNCLVLLICQIQYPLLSTLPQISLRAEIPRCKNDLHIPCTQNSAQEDPLWFRALCVCLKYSPNPQWFFPPIRQMEGPCHLLALHHWLPEHSCAKGLKQSSSCIVCTQRADIMPTDVIVCLCVTAMATGQVGSLQLMSLGK